LENFQKEYNPGKFCCIKLGEEIITEGEEVLVILKQGTGNGRSQTPRARGVWGGGNKE
jgi:hypothetical protein